MSMKYNAEQAQDGFSGSNALQEGMHAIKITQAYKEVSTKKTVGLHLDFEDKAKKKGRTTIWYEAADGTPNDIGGAKIQSLMALAGMQGFNDVRGDHFEYDFETKEDVVVDGINHPEFEGKYFNFLLDKSPYESQTGEWKYRLELAGAYNMNTMQTAGEFLTEKDPEQHEKDVIYSAQKTAKTEAKIDQMNAGRDKGMDGNKGFGGGGNSQSGNGREGNQEMPKDQGFDNSQQEQANRMPSQNLDETTYGF